MNLKRVATFAILCFLVCTTCFAELTLWLQDGTSLRAFKIVFHGQTADVYLLDGSVRQMPVSRIDLKSSGIGKAEGTYGGQGSGPSNRPITTPPIPVNQTARQAQLKDEWERSERTAVALNNVGPIRSGDIVRIVGQTEEQPSSPYSFTKPVPKDNAFVILYKLPDGTYGKRLFDAATFASNFKIREKPAPTVSLPVQPLIPETLPAPPAQVESKTPQQPEVKTPAPVKTKPVPSPQPPPVAQPGRSILPYVLAVIGIAVIAAIVILLSRKRRKAFVDVSLFRKYEDELRDFEIEIWLKHGKTHDQLTEICLKKFYGDQPGPMSVVTKVQKGLDGKALISFIGKQGEMDDASAEKIYSEIKQRFEWIRSTIDSVARRVGQSPLPEVAPTGIMPVPKPPAAKPASQPAAAPPPAPPVAVPSPRVTTPKAAPTSTAPPKAKPSARPLAPGEIPQYLAGILKNLGSLSDPQ